ncbi:AP-4 complex accessory subunit RUSC1 isoform 2-T3 [Anomaloglossus baeobatrachus]|uniref:AP-4 complex accessory subunit RUSC1 isoform X2 n=1 Tax=Anomaloglossus baeobatrachus TaxID=238106 RepID=UPI003F4F960D
MLASRQALLGNLNYVHLQHVSLGVHLSMHPEVTDTTMNQGTGVKDGCHHKWRDTTEVDPNSNDPSISCQCCDQHQKQESLQYSSLEDLEAIICDECLSPDDLPLSPLSLSSPSTDSSSSSDFTLDDSPASMYYKEYSQDGLDTPDLQPDIIPPDVATDGPFCPSTHKVDTTPDSNLSETNYQKITNNNNVEVDDTPYIDWDSDSILDSNSNTLIEKSGSSSLDSDTITEPELQTNNMGQDQWSEEQDLLPGLPFLENTSTPTSKKTITSFHELALRRRKSGVQLPSQPKRDRSDWLIVFSPDTEQPPINELTVSAFDHEILESQTHPLSAAKGVTTFRELRYRNTLNKMSVQQIKVHEERTSMTSAEATTELSPIGQVLCGDGEHKDSQQLLTTNTELHDNTIGEHINQTPWSQCSKSSAWKNSIDTNIPSWTDHTKSGLGDTLPRIQNIGARYGEIPDKEALPTAAMTWIRGLADGGDQRGQDVCNLWPPYPYSLKSRHSFGPDYPHTCGPAQLPWYSGLPPRLSPVGASSPPRRALLPLIDTPDAAVLLSPMFPRKRTFIRVTRGQEAWCQVKTDHHNTAAECELLMAEEAEDSVQWQKKSLLIAVGSSVEKIISHFNTSRNQVQKAQLGDSRLSPVLGYLILNHLCPSLYSLLGDGLKPYQKDVIIGRRRSSPWSLVEVSTKTGPETVQLLFNKVSHLPQLRDPQRKFNAFIFGLLNMKQLDMWVLQLHQMYDQICTFYLPSGFLALAATLHLDLRDELLLSLQPLSALTFHTDLLFEHHHLSLHDLPSPHRAHSPMSDNWAVPSFQNILDLGGWITHNLIGNPQNKSQAPNKGKALDVPGDKDATNGSKPSPAVLHRNRPHGRDTLVHSELSSSSTDNAELLDAYNTKSSQGLTPSNWWGYLSQSSRIYSPAHKESMTFFTLRKLTSWGPMEKEPNHRESATKERDLQEQRLEEMISRRAPQNKPRGTDHQNEEGGVEGKNTPQAEFTRGISEGHSCSARAEPIKDATTMDGSRGQYLVSEEKGNWLGQLFGASSSHGREAETWSSISRRPSSWLLPNVNVWHLIKKQSTPGNGDATSGKEEEQKDHSRPQRSLRALCDHSASAKSQLSFKKGDVLQVLGTVDEDWIQCRRGSDTGLVPVGYTSLIL